MNEGRLRTFLAVARAGSVHGAAERLTVTQPAVTLAFLSQPVDFGALDGQPVKVLFLLLSPSVREHLPGADGKIVFDKFHIAKHLGEAVDRVRRREPVRRSHRLQRQLGRRRRSTRRSVPGCRHPKSRGAARTSA